MTPLPREIHLTMQSTFDPSQSFHVAIIMDGNGRWARRRGLPRVAGHRAGAKAVRRTVEAASKLGIDTLTLYAFSSDNWQRPKSEVAALMRLLEDYLNKESHSCVENDIRLNVIGRRDRLPEGVVRAIERAEAMTASCSKFRLRLAVDYSSRHAILGAARYVRNRTDVSPEDFGEALNLAVNANPHVGDVDLLIRTSGEKRLSDFMLWECAYAELVFTDTYWPDFGEQPLSDAVGEFRSRERRFGRVLEASG